MVTLRILLVENDAVIASLLAEMLQSIGHKVCGIEATEMGAVTAAAQHKPDLMIVDMHLAEGSGTSAMERISRIQFVPHLFISGKRPLVAPGNAELLRKPFREAELAAAIARVMRVPAGVQP